MELIVERLNGDRYVLNEEIGILVRDFYPDSPSPDTQIATLPGVDGHIDLGTRYEGRVLRASLYVTGINNYHYAMVRHQIFQIFDSREEFYLICSEESRKRWRVKCDASFSVNRIAGPLGELEIGFISASSYAESLGTLKNKFTFAEDVWAFGLNMPFDELHYSHATRRFDIWNLGDAVVDGRKHYLAITYKGASNNLTIRNSTTGDEWNYNGTTNTSDTILLDGVFSRKNGSSIFGQTNRKPLLFARGKNEITLTGTSGAFQIDFDFKFLFF